MPMDVNPFFNQAQVFVRELVKTIPLTSAILDYWNRGYVQVNGKMIKIQGARIIYGCQFTHNCRSDCDNCVLLNTVGIDGGQILDFRTTLCYATPEDLALFSSKQKCLNYKTLEEYLVAFIEYILQKCHSNEDLNDELDWMNGFRITFLDGVYDEEILRQKENESKKYIILRILKVMQSNNDSRWQIVHDYAISQSLI